MPSAGLHPVEIRAVFGEQEPLSDNTLVAVSCFTVNSTRTGNQNMAEETVSAKLYRGTEKSVYARRIRRMQAA